MSLSPDILDHPARILIVDDERPNRELLEVLLAPEGFELVSAASGADALAMVARQPPDLILIDVMMPGMNGYDVAGKIKGDPATKHIPVILITALDDRNARMLGLSAGAEDFLTKPVDRAELCVRVRNLLRLKAYADYHGAYSQMLECEVGSRTAELIERTATLERQAGVLTEQAALLDLAPGAIIVCDMHDRIVFWSRGAKSMYGWSSDDAVGRSKHELLRITSSEPPDVEATLLRDGTCEGEALHHTRDGARVFVASRWALQRDADGAPVRILTINSDITARKQADSELRSLTERLRLATAVAQVGVWEWDLASNTLTWDATMFDIYGFIPVVPLPYDAWPEAVCPDDLPTFEATLQRAIDDKGSGSAEFRIVRSDGSVRTVSSVEAAVLDERGIVSRLIGVNMDVTKRKEAEQTLEQNRQDQLRFKDEFLSHVSHELRSPLTAIKQFTTILLGGMAGELNEEQHTYQTIVLKNVGQLQSMIGDLLEVTRLETGKFIVNPECASLPDAVTDTFNTLKVTADAKRIALSCDLPLDLPSVYADQIRLRQILIILLDNAVKFTPDGGAVTLRAQPLRLDPHFLLIEVSDTGCGISKDRSKRIFERLYQVPEPSKASRKGIGLGLYICKELVTRQGGHIWVEHPPHRGTTFVFTLPIFSPASAAAQPPQDDTWPAESATL